MLKRFKRAAKSAVKSVAKTTKRVVKSKPFRVAALATAAYFTAGAAMGAMGKGAAASQGLSGWAGAKAGLANAGSQLAAAGSAVMKGNFAQAGSALKSGAGFGGGAVAAGSASPVAGAGSSVIPGASAASTPVTSGLTATSATSAGAGAATGAGGGLLSGAWNSLGDAGKAAVITGGMQMAGSAMEGRAEEKRQQEMIEAQRRRLVPQGDYGLMQMGNMDRWQPPAPANTTLDDLIKRQRQTVATQNFGG